MRELADYFAAITSSLVFIFFEFRLNFAMDTLLTSRRLLEPTEWPRVTVIVPMLNEECFIARTLAALQGQTYPHERYEVLVIDGMSSDRSPAIVREFQDSWPELRLLENSQRLIPPALNIGLHAACGQVIIRVDAHTIVESSYIEIAVQSLIETGAENVGGLMRAHGEGLVAGAIAAAMASPFGMGPGKFHYSEQKEQVDTVYMGAFWRDTLIRLGGWDQTMLFSEDDELNVRIRKEGGQIWLIPAIRSQYYCRSSVPSLARQFFRYGRYKVRSLLKHGMTARRQLIPPLFVGAVFAGAALSLLSVFVLKCWLAFVSIYLTANLCFSFGACRRVGLRYVFIVPAIFMTLHISYGIGYWRGLIENLISSRAETIPSETS